MFRKWIVLFLVLGLLVPGPLHAKRNSIEPDITRMFTAEAVGASGTKTTAAYGELILSENQSIAWRGVGTSPNFKVEVLCSLDGVNYVIPATGGTVSAATTDQNWHVAFLAMPLCRSIKIQITNLNAVNTLAVDVILASQ